MRSRAVGGAKQGVDMIALGGKAADLAARNPRFMLVPESVAWNRSLWPWTQQKNVAATSAKRRHRIGDVILLAGC
jgi:hypothetical protein